MFESIVFYLGMLVLSILIILSILVFAPIWIPIIVGSTIVFYGLAAIFGILYLIIEFIRYLFNK